MMRGWVLLAAAALMLVPTALAAQGTVTGRSDLPIEAAGLHRASASHGAFLLEGQSGQATLLVQGATASATRVIHRAFGYVNTQDPKAEVLWDDAVEQKPLDLTDSILTLDERLPEFRLLVYDGAPTLDSGAAASPLLLGALDHAKTVDYALDSAVSLHLNPPSDADRFSQVLPGGTYQARSDDGDVGALGAFSLFVSDATLTLRGAHGAPQEIPAHFRIETQPGSAYNPVSKTWFGPGSHAEYVTEYLLVQATDAHLGLQYSGVPGSLYAAAPSIDVDGHALLPHMTGTVAVTEDGKTVRHAVSGSDLDLAGRFTLQPHGAQATPATTLVEGEGDITGVTYAGTAAHYDWTKVATAGVGMLALLAVAWGVAKAAGPVGGGLLAGYARVSGQEILEHPGRAEVYERVKANPGINFVQLSGQVAFGASTLNYHLRVLERNEYIASVKDGRYLRFFDRAAGTYAGAKKVQVSALRNTTTAAMARHIRDHPGIAQCDLASAFGVTASTVNWHMTRLAGAGLVERTRDAHYTRYYLSQGWSQLPASEMERLSALPAPVAPLPLLAAPLAV
jgi:DNA-binding transcriptional ArsR family regulator